MTKKKDYSKIVKEMSAIRAIGAVKTSEGIQPAIMGILNRKIQTPKGVKVFGASPKFATGVTTGRAYRCRLTGCPGYRIVVKWKDGLVTHPCSKGMRLTRKGWRIL